MTEQEVVDFVAGLGGVEVIVASADNGAPEVAWGDVFMSLAGQRQPFATIVKRDYPGVDETSRLDRDGVFRVNIGIGREALRARLRWSEAVDPAEPDRLFPHPVYASHGWISVLNPDTTAEEVRDLLRIAHARASAVPRAEG